MKNNVEQVYSVFVSTLGIGIIRQNNKRYYERPTRASVKRLSFLLDLLVYRGTAKASVQLHTSVAPMVQWFIDADARAIAEAR